MDLINVKVTFYSPDGAEAGTLTSRTGDYNTADNLFIARENVVLITPGANGDRRLETEELHYDIGGDQIWTDSPFVLHEQGRVSQGTRFRTDSQFRTWEVTGLQTEGPVPGEGGLTF
jgi:LPS export ABC transporter protein LptC